MPEFWFTWPVPPRHEGLRVGEARLTTGETDGALRWTARRYRRGGDGLGREHRVGAARRTARRGQRVREERPRLDGEFVGQHRTESADLARRRSQGDRSGSHATTRREVRPV